MKLLYTTIILFIAQNLFAHSDCESCGLYFIENKGQWQENIRYKSDFSGGAFFFEADKLTFALCDAEQKHKAFHHAGEYKNSPDSFVQFHAYQMIFENALPSVRMQEDEQTSDYFNYFIGNDKTKWKGHCNAFHKIIYRNLYDGIDAEVYSHDYGLKYDFYAKPHSDISQISLKYEGIDEMHIDENGNLIFALAIGDVVEQKPYAYQIINGEKREIACKFRLEKTDKKVSFSVQDYDENYTLVIDPHIVFATYSGSTTDNFGCTATYDKYGNAYSAGSAFGTGYPTTLGAYQVNYAGGPNVPLGGGAQYPAEDIGLTKYDSSGTSRIYSTYLGGYGSELPHSLIVNDNDELYVFGTTTSADFPVTSGAYDTTFAGGTSPGVFLGIAVYYNHGSDIIISKFSADGSSLLASTFVGGNKNDGLNYNSTNSNIPAKTRHNYADESRGEIDIAPDGGIVIASTTRSQNYPQTISSVYTSSTGVDADACATKLTPELDSIIWSVKFGGTMDDIAYSVAFGADSSVYLCGGAVSPDFPVPGIGRQKTFGGGITDGWIYHIGKNADTILSTTFQGSTAYDQAYFIEVGRTGDVFVFGQCDSSQSNFIFNAAYNKPNGGQFITRFNGDLTSWIWSTSFGRGLGVTDISPTAFLVDICSSVYVSGWGSANVQRDAGWAYPSVGGTTGLDVTPGAWQTTTDGGDFYLMVMLDDASALQYATFVGAPNNAGNGQAGEHVDGGTSRFDRKGVVYEAICESCGGYSTFPTYPANCVSPTNGSFNCNNLMFKFDLDIPLSIADFDAHGCANYNIPFTNLSTFVGSNVHYYWNFGDGSTSTQTNPTHTYVHDGYYTITLRVVDSMSCNITDSVTKTVRIFIAQRDTLPTIGKCPSDTVQIGVADSAGGSYQWIPAAGLDNTDISNPNSFTDTSILYTLYYSHNYCTDTLLQQVNAFLADLNVTGGNVNCPNDQVTLSVSTSTSGNWTYSWLPESLIVSGEHSTTAVATPIKDTTFVVEATDPNGCIHYGSTFVNVNSTLGDATVVANPDTIWFGDTSQITATFDGSVTGFAWDASPSLSATNVSNPEADPRQTTTYTLNLSDILGCTLKQQVTVVVLHTPCGNNGLYIPNAFTPNNDGKNDVWYVRGNDIKSVTIMVYDRWGQKMFESHDITNGWDGRFNGKALDPAVFGWYVEGVCDNDEKFLVKGNVTILR